MSDNFDLGIDIVPISKVEDLISGYGDRLSEVYTEKEIAYCRGKKNAGAHFAVRFAAKEAVLKALGLGLGKGIEWTDVETLSSNSGRPRVCLHGKLEEIAYRRYVDEIKISLSHCEDYAVAQAMVRYTRNGTK
jgi:holo-[acyl-carrier protein] synthase